MKNSKNYKIIVITILQFLSSCIGVSQSEKQELNSPNIIFIVTDDQGWTHTSHHADPNIPESKSDYYETPNMDKLAKSGVLFTQGYTPNPICSPSRHSLMFGQNAARHIYNKDADWYKKTADWLTIPRAIKKANQAYKTAHFGKWHIGMVPEDAGFDYDDGMTSNSGGEIFGDDFFNIKQYTEVADQYMQANKIENPSNAKRAGKPSGHWDDENAKDIFGITSRAKKFMKESIVEGKPFYLQLSHYAAHLSLVSQKETYDYFKNKKQGERHTNPEFAAMLKDLDTGVGMIMDFVKEQGIEENTYIFLMGDNGGRTSLNQIAVIDENKQLVNAYYSTQHDRNIPLRDGKHSFYEGGLRVPFMAVGPGIKANRISNTPVTGLDLLPTFTQLAGGNVDLTEVIDGGSMVPLLLDENVEKIERNSEYLIYHQSSHRKPRSAIRKGDFKLIKYWSKEKKYENTPKVELFNITEDLAETNNLINKHPEIGKELETELRRFLTTTNAETGIRDIKGPFYRLNDDLAKGKIEKAALLYENPMASESDMKDWILEGPAKTEYKAGWMQMYSPNEEGHHVFWCPEDFPASFIAEWELQNIEPDAGLCIVFFAAKGNNGESIFDPSFPKRNGIFRQYTKSEAFNNYHISYYANGKDKRAREVAHLRKNSGFHKVQIGEPGIPIHSTAIHKMQLVKNGAHIRMFVDGRKIIDWTDDGKEYGAVLNDGKIGLRQMQWSNFRYRNLKIWSILK